MDRQESLAEKPMRVTSTGQFLKIKDVARILGVSQGWVRGHVTKKKPTIPHMRIGGVVRFDAALLEEFLAKYGVRDEGT